MNAPLFKECMNFSPPGRERIAARAKDWIFQANLRDQLTFNFVALAKSVGYGSLGLLAAGLISITNVHKSLAEDAETAPTCTGCDSDTPSRGAHSERPRGSKRESLAPKSSSLASYDGTWSGTTVGPCIVTWSVTLHVNNGIISGNNVSGHISSGGFLSGAMVVFSHTYDFKGRANSSEGQASGTWKSDECSGTWTLTR
jgi:hypothetical protein